MFKKNASATTKVRFDIVNKEYIPILLKEGIVVKQDEVRLFGDLKPALWVQQNGVTSDGKKIPAGHIFNTNRFVGDHSKIPHVHGGQTVPENGKMETPEWNGEKSDKIIESN